MDKDLKHECPKCKGLFYQATTCAKCMLFTKPLNSKTESGANVQLDRVVGPACEFCNDTGEKVDHKVEGAPAAAMVFCDCPAGDAVRELIEEASASK